MRHRRTWLIVGALLVALAVIVIVALPVGVRVLAERRAEALTGREVTIGDVDLNLFTRRLVATDVRVHAPPGEPAPLTLARLSARFRWVPLLRGRVHLDRLALADVDMYLERTAPRRFNVSDVVTHIAARPAGEPLQAVVETLLVSGGRVRLHDHAVDPDRSWVLRDVALEAHDVVTIADAAQGRGSATFMLAGAPGALDVDGLGLRPPQARATLKLDGLDVSGLAAYFPRGAPVWLSGGRLTTRLTVDYDAGGALRASGEASLRDLTLASAGQEPPLLAVPALSLTARDLHYAAGDISAGRVELAADRLIVLDATAARPRPLDVTALRAAWDVSPKASQPASGRLTVTADLPEGGRLVARGTADPLPAAADIDVEVSALDVGLARAWIPAGAAVEPVAGRLAGTLRLRYADAQLVAGGRLRLEGLAIAREGQQTVFLRDEQVLATLRDLRVHDGRLTLGRVEISGSPTVTDASVSPAQRLHVPRVSVVAEGGAIPGGPPARLRVDATLPLGGRVEAEGTGTLGPPALRLEVRATDADLAVAAPYVPQRSPIALQRGRLDARLSVAWDRALRAAGRLVARDLALLRRGQSEPFIHHPSLEASLTGLVLRDGQLSVERVALRGTPTIVDATASPPQRFDTQHVTLTVSDFTWPGQHAARVEGRVAVTDGGRGELTGTLHPATLATDVRARFENVDVTRAAGYLPATTPLVIEHGRGAVAVTLRHRRGDGIRLDADGAVADAALRLTTGPGVRIRDQRIAFTLTDLVVSGGTTSLGAASLDGAPAIGRGGEPAPALSRLHAELRGLRWPGGPPAPWRLAAEPAGGGRVTATGTLAPATRTVAGTVEAEDAAIAAFSALLPVHATVAGRLDGRLRGEVGADRPAVVTGELTLSEARVGPSGAAPIRVERIESEGLVLREGGLTVSRLVVVEPGVVVEREKDGTFPLRAMLDPEPSPAASPGPREPAERRGEVGPGMQLSIEEVIIRDGNVRFIDRSTTPFYSEELSRLTATIRNVTSAGDDRATVQIQGIVGVDAALDLAGEVAPFGTPFFLDVRGELREFSVPRTNPLLQRFLDWIARRGELTTRVHYRIVGDELSATNEIVVHRLDVERAGDDDRTERLVGLPLGLVVALLKDARGEIHVSVPISGALSSPRFSFGDAIRSALKNVVGRLVTAPFRAIGSVFQRDGEVEDVAVDPVGFEPGSAVLTPEAAAHLQRVADFLRASPYVRLTLQPVVGEDDLRALRAQEVAARIQRVQREQGLGDFAEAARRVWHDTRPGEAPPDDPRAIVRALAEREPVPTEAARRLAERRASVTRTHLAEAAGIPRDRLLEAPGDAPIGAGSAGRVEFGLGPAS